MEAAAKQPPIWLRFLFCPYLPAARILLRGPQPGAATRGVLNHIRRLLWGRDQGEQVWLSDDLPKQLDAMFADDAGMDWRELRDCHQALCQLLDASGYANEKSMRRVVEEFVDNFLFLSPEDEKRFIDDVAAYVGVLQRRRVQPQEPREDLTWLRPSTSA